MSDSLVCCCLCLRDIEKSYERVNLERCKKDFDSLAEIESLEISHRDSKYICRQCVAKLKKRRGLIIQKAQVESELKSICDKSKRKGDESVESDVDSSAKRPRTVEPDSFPLQSSPVRSASATRAVEWPVSPVQSTKTQALSSCNFCCRVIKEKYDRVILEKGTKSFDVMAEIASLSFPLQTIGSKYGCRNCINKLKRRRTVITQLEDLETELRKGANQNVSENKSQVEAPVSELQSTATTEHDLIDCTTDKKKKVEVTVTAKWPSKVERKNLPEDLTSLGKTLVRGTYKQIANAVWKNEKIKKEMQLVKKEVERECTHLCSKKNPSCLRKTDKEDMLDFSMEKLCSEVEDRAAMLHTVLSAAAINRRSRAETETPAARFGAVGMAAAVCLRNRSRYMIAVQFLITNFLYHSNWGVGTKIVTL